MHRQPHDTASGVQPHLVARQVEGNLWMLYNTYYEQLLDDFGWFQNRTEAEAKIAELQRVMTPVRYSSHASGADAMN